MSWSDYINYYELSWTLSKLCIISVEYRSKIANTTWDKLEANPYKPNNNPKLY